MKVVLDIGVFAIVIVCSFFVGSMFASKYIINLLNEEGYIKTKKNNHEK